MPRHPRVIVRILALAAGAALTWWAVRWLFNL